jgi:Glycosyltransferase family 87
MAQVHAPGAATRVDGSPYPNVASLSLRSRWYLFGVLVSLALVGLWVSLFVASVRQDRLVVGRSTWVLIAPCLGVDFKLAIDYVARVEALGLRASQFPDDPHCVQYPYPPMIGRYFRWVTLFDRMTASVVWQCTLPLFGAIGCLAAWRTRKKLGLDSMPLMLMFAAFLFSTPFIYAVERGQCDPMIIPLLVVAAWLLGKRGTWAELGAGGLLALTAWIKYYPGLAVIALFALGRKKAMAAFVAVVALIGVVDRQGIRESITAGKLIESGQLRRIGTVHESSHSFIEAWKLSASVRGSALLSRVPEGLPTAILLIPALYLVSRGVARAKDPKALTYPYLLWLTSAATFALPYSNDYNLCTLPLAMMALWDRRDRATIQLLLALSLLWLQPIWLPIDGGILVFFKLGALYAVGACLVARASVSGQQKEMEGRANLFRPAFAHLARPHRDIPGSRSN